MRQNFSRLGCTLNRSTFATTQGTGFDPGMHVRSQPPGLVTHHHSFRGSARLGPDGGGDQGGADGQELFKQPVFEREHDFARPQAGQPVGPLEPAQALSSSTGRTREALMGTLIALLDAGLCLIFSPLRG